MTKTQIEQGAIPAVVAILHRYNVRKADIISEVVVSAVIDVIRELKETEAKNVR